MARTEPQVASPDYPLHKVDAKCPDCGKEGRTKALRRYPEGTVIAAKCQACVQKYEATLRTIVERSRREALARSHARSREPKDSRSSRPSSQNGDTSHWTDYLEK